MKINEQGCCNPCVQNGVSQDTHPSRGPHRPSLSSLSPQGQGHHCRPGLPPRWSSEEVDWNYLVQWFFTRTSQLQLICQCWLASQGALGTSKQTRKGNSILLQPLSHHAAQWTKGSSVAAGLLGRSGGKRTDREGSSVVECVTEKHL